MAIPRVLFAAVLALFVTVGLVWLMQVLISEEFEPEDTQVFKIGDIVVPKRSVETEFDDIEIEKPDEDVEPPPPVPEQNLDNPDAEFSVSKLAPSGGDKVVFEGGFGGGLLRLAAPPAKYPSRALSAGWEGYCVVAYDVNTTGETENVVAESCSRDTFKRASVDAVKKYKFRPAVEDGQPVVSRGLKIKIDFELQK